jgi:segregation and condensation protein B
VDVAAEAAPVNVAAEAAPVDVAAETAREPAVADAAPEPVAAEAAMPDSATGPAPEPDAAPPEVTEDSLRLAEALLFASDRPVAPSRLAALLPEGLPAHVVLAALQARYAGRGVEVAEVAGGFAFRTAADLAPRLTKVVEAPRRLPRAAMEALAIIAYHQPCTRTEIEEIRGATLAQTTLEQLLELGLVQPRGRRETPGRPTLWGTTPRFLEQFGLKALTDLPKREELVSENAPQLPLHAPASAAPAPAPAGAPAAEEPGATPAEPPPAAA